MIRVFIGYVQMNRTLPHLNSHLMHLISMKWKCRQCVYSRIAATNPYAQVHIKLNNRPGIHNLSAKIDTGAQGNTIPLRTFRCWGVSYWTYRCSSWVFQRDDSTDARTITTPTERVSNFKVAKTPILQTDASLPELDAACSKGTNLGWCDLWRTHPRVYRVPKSDMLASRENC